MNPRATESRSDLEPVVEAIDRVQQDVEKVEFWACAFSGLTAPIPAETPAGIWGPQGTADTRR